MVVPQQNEVNKTVLAPSCAAAHVCAARAWVHDVLLAAYPLIPPALPCFRLWLQIKEVPLRFRRVQQRLISVRSSRVMAYWRGPWRSGEDTEWRGGSKRMVV